MISLVNRGTKPGSIIEITIKFTIMKTSIKYAIALLLAISIVVNGLTSYHLFRLEDYNISSLLIIAAYASIVLSIFVVTNRSQRLIK